jgi:hypothetical protein
MYLVVFVFGFCFQFSCALFVKVSKVLKVARVLGSFGFVPDDSIAVLRLRAGFLSKVTSYFATSIGY